MRSGPIAHCSFLPGGQPSVASRQLYRNPEHSSEKRCSALFEALSDQESDQERGASKLLAPHYRTRI